ncbi:phosphoglycolate phosphatase [Aestuariivirga litoralis]|uniref:phosphoglycolate phosphatase n=1 Tax=Aestuariivirga litoralis TaxID=2650924 RepID=UPI0018C631A8|nr:phosphoglycolate phosphatase [Aestuariivirga litoralis]MBG1232105.1 phosphoglycolate phosphatase [Aestuariivirga litoralis]
MPVEALIFDLDGTLVDTAPDLINAANYALKQAGRNAISDEQLRSFVGHGALSLIKQGLAATGGVPDETTVLGLRDQFIDYYNDNIAVGSKVFDGLEPVLKAARQRGIKLGVCTNKLEGLSHRLLKDIGLASYFDAVVGGDTLPVMKPDPAPYFEVARLLGVDAKRTIMFGDSETDIRTAQAAGVPVIAVSFGYTPQHVSAFDPDHVIDHYDEAWSLVEAYV